MAAAKARDEDQSRGGGSEGETMSASTAASTALHHIGELITSNPAAVTSVEPVDDGWLVEVEVLEERRIPSSSDLLALYEIELDLGGDLLAYRRTKRYPRGRTDLVNGAR
ncbi:gas vesicle protein [Amycolatopsis sp. GM8]|uniref:gas vesicle protein GvpO n=1 Tax=Amycolatopsis sp. GM8 TaxID=2896530 RepID=UPI001F199302|nr:gas vesicle protein [Amycolatopsis sp. GM8]